jgi:hypothetical protein
MAHDPIYRKYHHDQLTFRMVYAFHENFVLPLSHDEVVHGKGSLIGKMPGDDWRKFANLRLLLGYMYTQPGKKLLFMGGEFGQWREWNHDEQLDWSLLQYDTHRGVQRWIEDLNRVYRDEPALHRRDCDPEGFAWITATTATTACLPTCAGAAGGPRRDRRLQFHAGAAHELSDRRPRSGYWEEILNSDAEHLRRRRLRQHGRPRSLAHRLARLLRFAEPHAPAAEHHRRSRSSRQSARTRSSALATCRHSCLAFRPSLRLSNRGLWPVRKARSSAQPSPECARNGSRLRSLDVMVAPNRRKWCTMAPNRQRRIHGPGAWPDWAGSKTSPGEYAGSPIQENDE